MKRKIAIVLHGLGANGIDSLFANLSNKWDYENFDITYFVAVDEDAHQFWEDYVKENGVKVVHLHDLDRNRIIKWPRTLFNAFKQYGPFDAVHVNMDMLNGINLMIAKRAGIPERICHAHRSNSENTDSRVKKFYISIMRKMIHKFASKCIACSDVAGEYFYKGNDYDILYNGIDNDKYRCDRDGSQTELRFITVGRMTPQKNPLFLIEIFKKIVDRKPTATLKWCGTGEMLEEVQLKIEELGIADDVQLMGVRSDISEILKDSDFFLLPSVFEGLSLALAEAQAAGLDCFVSDTVSKMSDCGKCMFIPLEKTASEWAEEICSYIDGADKMSVNKGSLSKFDIGQMARKLEVYYKG